MQDARVEMSAEGRPILRFERHLSRRPSAVWRALTQPDELNAWFPCDIITEEWEVGASLRFVFGGGEGFDLHGTVLECDPPNTLAFTWGEETLRFELTEVDGGTWMVFTDELDPSIAARNAAGWDVCLERLEGNPTHDDLWRVRFDRYVDAFVPTLGVQEGPPSND